MDFLVILLIYFFIVLPILKKIRECFHTSPLAHAARQGNLMRVKQMIEQGYDVNERDDYNRTPLMCLMGTSHVEIVRYLLENGASINLVDKSGRNVWHYLTISEITIPPSGLMSLDEPTIKMAELLLEFNGAKYINDKDSEGKIPLIKLFDGCVFKNPFVMALLMLDSGSDGKIVDFKGNNCVYYVNNSTSILKYISAENKNKLVCYLCRSPDEILSVGILP